MSDLKLRNLEREAISGDTQAIKRLNLERCRQGNCCLHAAGMARYAASDWYLKSRKDGGLTCCWCGRRTYLAMEERQLHGAYAPDDPVEGKSSGGYYIP